MNDGQARYSLAIIYWRESFATLSNLFEIPERPPTRCT